MMPGKPIRFFSITEVADFLCVSTRTVRRWIEKGWLIAHGINGLVRISEADFHAFLASHRDC
jgi:excisionase family DNA binding protein